MPIEDAEQCCLLALAHPGLSDVCVLHGPPPPLQVAIVSCYMIRLGKGLSEHILDQLQQLACCCLVRNSRIQSWCTCIDAPPYVVLLPWPAKVSLVVTGCDKYAPIRGQMLRPTCSRNSNCFKHREAELLKTTTLQVNAKPWKQEREVQREALRACHPDAVCSNLSSRHDARPKSELQFLRSSGPAIANAPS